MAGAWRRAGVVLREGGHVGIGERTEAVAQVVDKVLRPGDIDAELKGVAAGDPGEVIDELVAILAGEDARQDVVAA